MPRGERSGWLRATVAPARRSTLIGDFHDPYGATVAIAPIVSEHVRDDALRAKRVPRAEGEARNPHQRSDPVERVPDARGVEDEAEARRHQRHRDGGAKCEEPERRDRERAVADAGEEEDADPCRPAHPVHEPD